MSIVGVSREYKQLWHVGVVVGQGVRPLRGCVEEGFIDVEKQHAEDDEVDLSQDAVEYGYLHVTHANAARLCPHLSVEFATVL